MYNIMLHSVVLCSYVQCYTKLFVVVNHAIELCYIKLQYEILLCNLLCYTLMYSVILYTTFI